MRQRKDQQKQENIKSWGYWERVDRNRRRKSSYKETVIWASCDKDHSRKKKRDFRDIWWVNLIELGKQKKMKSDVKACCGYHHS